MAQTRCTLQYRFHFCNVHGSSKGKSTKTSKTQISIQTNAIVIMENNGAYMWRNNLQKLFAMLRIHTDI
jgi:hypothetical protein